MFWRFSDHINNFKGKSYKNKTRNLNDAVAKIIHILLITWFLINTTNKQLKMDNDQKRELESFN